VPDQDSQEDLVTPTQDIVDKNEAEELLGPVNVKVTHRNQKRRFKAPPELKEEKNKRRKVVPTEIRVPVTKAFWKWFSLLVFVIVGVGVLSYFAAKYDFDYDSFIKNYEILGVSAAEETPWNDIKKAYHALALKWHPDKCSECNNKYIEISTAYETLEKHHVAFWAEQRKKAVEASQKPTKVRRAHRQRTWLDDLFSPQ